MYEIRLEPIVYIPDAVHAHRLSVKIAYLKKTLKLLEKPSLNCESSFVGLLRICFNSDIISLVLGYGFVQTAFYIRCHDCVADFAEKPNSTFWVDWAREFRQAEKKLQRQYNVPAAK